MTHWAWRFPIYTSCQSVYEEKVDGYRNSNSLRHRVVSSLKTSQKSNEASFIIFPSLLVKTTEQFPGIRETDVHGNFHCSLLAAKSRLAPLKAMTIPGMELSVVVLATRLGRMIK